MRFLLHALVGEWVQLEPMSESHRSELQPIANDERIWQFTLTSGAGAHFDEWFDEALNQEREGRQIPFAVRRLRDGQLVGSSSYLDVSERHHRIEIGSTWYIPEVWGGIINPECKLLMLRHAFNVFAVNRVAFVTDRLNERSQAAIAKLGAVREGVLRCDKITSTGRVRDTVVFSIIASEWPEVEARLVRRLAELRTAAAR